MSIATSSKSLIATAVLFVLAMGACGQRAESGKLAALDEAYRSGVLTKSEYEAKKAALGNQDAALAALDKARDAGLLTPAEYQEHRAHLAATAAARVAPNGGGDSPYGSASAHGPAPATSATPSSPVAATIAIVRRENIADPNLQMNAYTVTVPAGWKFDGVFVAGSSCVPLPYPVFRTDSPDGLTEIRRLPRLDWSWSNSRFKPPQQAGCLNLKEELSAQDFVKYLIGVLKVGYVRDFPVPQALTEALQRSVDQYNALLAQNASQIDQLNASLPAMRNTPKTKPPTQHGALAAAIAEYRNGTFTIEEQLFVKLICTRSPINYGTEVGAFTESCNATVRIVRAPKGNLETVLAQVEAHNVGALENAEWVSKYLHNQQMAAKERSDKMFKEGAAQRAQMHDEFERAQAVRAKQSQEFIATMEEGTQRSMARAREASQARDAYTQDWCDYLLDRQTVTGTSGTVKISNAYAYTWTDGSGNYYQTNDSNANPNGVIRGDWSQTVQLHGNSAPKQ
jgi:hypothetical protein